MEDIDSVADITVDLLKSAESGAGLDAYRERVPALCRKHPLYLEPFEMDGLLTGSSSRAVSGE